jgi:hypothetical protein
MIVIRLLSASEERQYSMARVAGKARAREQTDPTKSPDGPGT